MKFTRAEHYFPSLPLAAGKGARAITTIIITTGIKSIPA
jgi:hypothetical protein